MDINCTPSRQKNKSIVQQAVCVSTLFCAIRFRRIRQCKLIIIFPNYKINNRLSMPEKKKSALDNSSTNQQRNESSVVSPSRYHIYIQSIRIYHGGGGAVDDDDDGGSARRTKVNSFRLKTF